MNDTPTSAPITPDQLRDLLLRAWEEVNRETPDLSVYKDQEHRLERAMVFRLGVHLNLLMEELRVSWRGGWHSVTVDSELHLRQDGKPKTSRSGEAPDLVVHRRGSDEFNLLVLEAKHRDSKSPSDERKLRELARDRHYRNAWAARLDLGQPIDIVRVH